MEKGSKTGLRARRACAASFVVTFAASAMHVGCNKTRTHNLPGPEIDPTPSATGITTTNPPTPPMHVVSRADGRCFMEVPMTCPPNARCNPPEPEEVDCPPGRGDASAPKKPTRRPAGKEDWLRIASRVYASNGECSFYDERFCAPPGKKMECTPYATAQKLTCTKTTTDGGTRFAIESFVYKDVLGQCHRIPKMECAGNCDPGEGTMCN